MIQSVNFKNRANTLAANLHLPENFDETKKYPALVGIHPAGGVKEQTIGLYADKLSKEGYIVLVYDSSYQGASEGEPRLLEDPSVRVEDARCAADFLSTLLYVDNNRLGVYGVCAGGGYTWSVAQTDRRFKAVATVSGTPMGEAVRNQFGVDIPASELIQSLEYVAQQRIAEANGAEPMYVPFVPEKFEDINNQTPVMLKEGYEYYRTPRGQHPNSKGRFLFTSLDKMTTFSVFDYLSDFLTQPLLIIAGSEADTKFFSERVFELAKGEKELFIIDGATHIALYDKPEYVNQAVSKMADFFRVI